MPKASPRHVLLVREPATGRRARPYRHGASALIHNSKPSSLVQGIRYDQGTRDLTVTLHGGKQYTYPDVSPETHNAFVSSDSHGRHFASVIAKLPHKS